MSRFVDDPLHPSPIPFPHASRSPPLCTAMIGLGDSIVVAARYQCWGVPVSQS